MPIRQRCNRVALSYRIQDDYVTALIDADIDKLFEPNEVLIPEVSIERVNDMQFIKPIEFPEDESSEVLVGQDCSLSYNFPFSLELAGLLYSLGLGVTAESGVGPYVHTMRPLLACSEGDQLPASSIVLGSIGDVNSYYKLQGVIPNEIRLVADSRQYLSLQGTFLTDGQMTAAPTFTFPASTAAANMILGRHADFLSVDEGGGALVSHKTLYMGGEFVWNNNLNVADARSLLAYPANSLYIGQLRFDQRESMITARMNAHRATDVDFWTDFLSYTMKTVQMRFDIDGDYYIQIDYPRCKIIDVRARFDGMRDVLEIDYQPWYSATDSAPVLVEIGNNVAEYQVAAT
jgi:hypothetical protein